MEVYGLSRRDLEPFIGGKSKISEVLAGKRPLTLDMIRRLHVGLGIPLDTLVGDMSQTRESSRISDSVAREMIVRGWLRRDCRPEELPDEIRQWLENCGIAQAVPAFCTRGSTRLGMRGDPGGILVWVGGVRTVAASLPMAARFEKQRLDATFFRGLTRLSAKPDGPALAAEYLAGFGIRLVVLRHFPGTYLDGAALFAPDGGAVAGLSLRHDRLDNFWFTLLHELAHLALGHVAPGGFLVDDLDVRSMDDIEEQANAMASEMLIPGSLWDDTPPSRRGQMDFVLQTAAVLEIDPAIVAGRVRRETGNYKLFSRIVGSREVRRHFPRWGMSRLDG
ncbi:MAG: ImmA/IrrE family metallo-endopeptidase [Desulfovibrionaceae bacterium]|nr:ImmA/IrrE family metallo-endopeptidase [Desulfovibrionaceae bacterium]